MATGFEGAAASGRQKGWIPTSYHLNQLLDSESPQLVRRCRHLIRNNALAKKARNYFRSQLVGNGMRPITTKMDQGQREPLMKLWRKWSLECDADGQLDFAGLQALVASEVFAAGECFVRLRVRRASEGLSVPLQLQVLPKEMLPTGGEGTTSVFPDRNVKSGIEFDRTGRRRTAYHFFRNHPGGLRTPQEVGDPRLLVRVPAKEVLHVYDVEEAGQIRGVPALAALLAKLYALDLYDDATVDRARVGALLAVFLRGEDAESFREVFGLDAGSGPDGSDPLQSWARALIESISLEPAGAYVVPPSIGSVDQVRPPEVGDNYEPFLLRQLQMLAAAVPMPYSALTGDYRNASYSSERTALIEFRRYIRQLQQSMIVHQLCRQVWMNWIDVARISGGLSANQIPEPEDVQWLAPAWEWVDPVKDRQAQEIAVEGRVMPRSHWILAEGLDPDDVREQIREDELAMAKLKREVQEAGPMPVMQPGQPGKTNGAAPPSRGNQDDRNASSDEA